ncbi:hypothetical protein G4177_06270 [Corallococcus sp. ZKHCc1 1396]|uniref:Uncharacterized protein n=1 Tax=Corallococcus soli TaxID=2710757 RepID=A0ABR9PIK8_9BACT|nr:hypothetical protein [Corallococcus soli]MBE4747783.1 hypothetical protein [Corallococcus soli]
MTTKCEQSGAKAQAKATYILAPDRMGSVQERDAIEVARWALGLNDQLTALTTAPACEHRHGARFGCDACAQRVREKLPTFPLQVTRDTKTEAGPTSIPWPVAEKAWATYSQRYGRDQSVERLAERGGFDWAEMDSFFPGWREATDAWRLLAKENAALQARVADLTRERDEAKAAAHAACTEVAAHQALLSGASRDAGQLESERDALRAQVAEQHRALLAVQATCRTCPKPATCWGAYEQHDAPWEPSCDDCCGHGNEDGRCERITALSTAPAKETKPGAEPACDCWAKSIACIHGPWFTERTRTRPAPVHTPPPRVPPLAERINVSLAKVGHELTPTGRQVAEAVDALHPTGSCNCAGDGTCEWCRARCGVCGALLVPESVRHALAQAWSALHVTTPHQGIAVAYLRAAYPELPVPGVLDVVDGELARRVLAAAVLDAAKLGAEEMRERAAVVSERAEAKTPGMKVGLHVVAGRIRTLPLPGEEVSRG